MDPSRGEDRVFESVAELFTVLATPIRLKITSGACSERFGGDSWRGVGSRMRFFAPAIEHPSRHSHRDGHEPEGALDATPQCRRSA